MRAGVLLAIGGAAAVLVATVPASAFYSGSDPETYYNATVRSVEAHRGWQGTEGVAFEPVSAFTKRLPDDEFDDILLDLVNWYRSEQGLAELEQFEPLRVQSAIRSNQLADAGTLDLPDRWYADDAVAACNPLTDIHSTSATSSGTPEDAYLQLLEDPATRNALLSGEQGKVGIATVAEGSQFFTTMRIAHGTCPGSGMPFLREPSGLPTPTIDAQLTKTSDGLRITVDRRGDQQLRVWLQRANVFVWEAWDEMFLEPGGQVTVHPPGGTYRVVVPAQNGYDVAFTDPIEIQGPPLPAQ